MTLIILLSALGSCSGQGVDSAPDKKTISTIKKAETAVYCELDPLDEDSQNGEILGYAKMPCSKTLTADDKDSIVDFLIGNKGNYRKSCKGKFCPPAPQDAFLFIKGSDTVTVVFDLNCASYSIVRDTLVYEYDFDDAQAHVSNTIVRFRPQYSVSDNSSLPTDTSQNMLSKKIRRVIEDADSVMCYLLDPMDKTCSDSLRGFCILADKRLESGLVDSLRNILLDDDSFHPLQYAKNCTFLCDLSFRFFRDDENADVMFAFYCNDCVAICGNESVLTDFGKMRNGILLIAKALFPKDKYIRHLLNK